VSATLPISETFVSIQGEGKLTGTPSWFCRVSGCNLRCTWCDTPYASWDPEKDTRTIDDLVDEARASGTRHAVLTGGEPMLFPSIVHLSRALAASGMHITVETAGTIARPGLACHLMSVSPKLANSTPVNDPRDPSGAWARRHEERRLNTSVLDEMIASSEDTQFKFVVASPGDLAEIDQLLAAVAALTPSDIMLMPEGVTHPEPESVRWIVEACLARGWSYCPRVHITVFGDTRGT